MSKYGSPSFSVLLADGYNLLAAKVQNFRHKVTAVQQQTNGLGDAMQAHTPTGAKMATLTQDGAFFEDATAGMHAGLNSAQGTSRVLSFAHAGNVVGRPFVGVEGTYAMAYEVLAENEKLTKANAQYQVTGQVDRGVILQPHEAKTADWNTESASEVDYTLDPSQQVIPIASNSQANPSVVTTSIPHGLTTGDIVLISGVSGSSPTINGQRTVTVLSTTTFSVAVDTSAGAGGTGGSFVRANSANGGVGYLQVSAASGFTNFVGKIRDSADDVTYADLITFDDNVVAPFAQRKTVAGVVDRYLAFDGNVTGTGSITPFVGFARS